MPVTITPTANTALDTDLILSGTVAISGALADNSEKLNVSVYYNNNGATYIGIPQVYDGTSTVTYNYANGTVLTVNYSTGAWTFQRLSTELSSTEYEYVITFEFKGGSTVSGSVTIKPVQNITITEFSVNTLDDLDNKATGTLDVTITDITAQKIKIDITADNVEMLGTAQNITSGTGTYTFTYSDGSTMVADLGNKTWEYTRKTTDVGDEKSNIYNIQLNIGGRVQSVYFDSYVGYAPNIEKFVASEADDTDSTITGTMIVGNILGASVTINVTHNTIEMLGTAQTYTENSTITWTFSDGSTFSLNTATRAWTYQRVQADCEDLREDEYTFSLNIVSRYGSDSESISLTTSIPSAKILGFSAEGVADTEPAVNGILRYTLPTVVQTPTMQIDVISNGTEYRGIPINLETATSISFTYSNDSKVEVDPDNGTFTFTRSSDDVEIVSNDEYTFKCTIIVNGQTTAAEITVKTYATARDYDYQPAYPVQFYAGSPEAENTAWPKYIEEIKRVYRLYNENMNYYESLTKGVFKRIDDLEKALSGIAANTVGVILPFVGDIEDIPDGWALCDGTNGTPDLSDRFLQGVTSDAGQFIEAGLPNITGNSGNANLLDQGGNGCFAEWIRSAAPWGGAGYARWTVIFDAESGRKYWHEQTYKTTPTDTIYGNSDTVQPKSYTVYYIMKVAES